MHYCSLGDDKSTIVRISEPIKSHFAKQKNLDLAQLMSQDSYKETIRKEMIEWSDEIRRVEPGYFCKVACTTGNLQKITFLSFIVSTGNFSAGKTSMDRKRYTAKNRYHVVFRNVWG